MADIGARRRGRSCGRGLSVGCLALGLASCADLLDLPSDPRLEQPTAQPVDSEPPRDGSARGEPSGPAPLLSDDSGGDDDPTSTGSVTAGPTPDTDDPTAEAPTGGNPAEPIVGGGADAGSPPLAPPDAGPPEPPDEPEEPPNPCAVPAILGPNDRCFLVVEETLAWEDARASCQARGDDWDLAAIRNAAVNDFVGTITDLEAWIGASDAATEGTWRWVSDGDAFWSGDGTTGEAVNGAFEAWNSNEPNGRGASDCARTVPIIRTGEGLTWADLECFELKASLCEGPPL